MKKWIVLGSVLGFFLFMGILFRACCVTFVDNYELAYKYDLRSGQITHLNRTGYVLYTPIVNEVHTVDLRPMQVCINANARVLNCKLVEFDPAGLDLFLSWHGRNNYGGPGNAAAGTTAPSTGNLEPILMSYAFDGSGKAYPFLKVLRDLRPEDVVQGAPQ